MPSIIDYMSKDSKKFTSADRASLKNLFEEAAKKDPRKARLFFTVLFDSIDNKNGLRNLNRDGFVNYLYNSYIDVDGSKRFLISITFVQSHDDFNDSLEVEIFSSIQSFLKAYGVENEVNDIAVNNVHFRNGGRVDE